MARQEPLNLYGRGIHRTTSGHLRYHSPRSLRNKYVHQVVIEKLLDETPYSIRILLPHPYQIHHIDYNGEHNNPSNLLLLSPEFHSALTAVRTRDCGKFARKFHPKWRPAPEWVLFAKDQAESERIDDLESASEVPF